MTSKKKNILAVDDDRIMLRLYATLQSLLGPGFEVFTALGAAEAFALMEKSKFEIVISDLNMPEVDGIEFLKNVMDAQPGAARLVVSSYSDHLKAAEALNVAHRYFSKPLDIPEFGKLLKRRCHYNYLLNNDRVRQMVFRTGALPILPESCLKLTRVLDSPYTQLDDISAVVEADPGLASRLLHTVNSAHFGISRAVLSCSEAVQIVGLEVLRSLMIGIELFDYYQDRPFIQESFRKLWAHSLQTAIAARKISQAENQSLELCNVAFIAGLLHDIGKLILAANAEREYRIALDLCQKTAVPLEQAERGIFGCTHSDVGAYLLVLWGFPDAVVDAVENHHRLSNINSFAPALAIHLGQYLDPTASRSSSLNSALIQRLGLASHLKSWKSLLAEGLITAA